MKYGRDDLFRNDKPEGRAGWRRVVDMKATGSGVALWHRTTYGRHGPKMRMYLPVALIDRLYAAAHADEEAA